MHVIHIQSCRIKCLYVCVNKCWKKSLRVFFMTLFLLFYPHSNFPSLLIIFINILKHKALFAKVEKRGMELYEYCVIVGNVFAYTYLFIFSIHHTQSWSHSFMENMNNKCKVNLLAALKAFCSPFLLLFNLQLVTRSVQSFMILSHFFKVLILVSFYVLPHNFFYFSLFSSHLKFKFFLLY